MPPLSIYVHLPWCIRKCPYCDFNSHQARGAFPEQQYVAAVIHDLEHEVGALSDRVIQSIYFGGGTPSLFSAAAINTILRAIHERFQVAPGIEITLEANPGAIDVQRFNAYRAGGVNRLSIGAQSFSDKALRKLGRVHDSNAAQAAIQLAVGCGFDAVNIDLMYGLPGATVEAARKDLDIALSADVQHISWYHLTMEPGTAFYRRPPADLPGDSMLAQIETEGRQALAEAGYGHYEISAYARDGYQSQHNLNYWQFGDYLGIGAGAHSKVSHERDDYTEIDPVASLGSGAITGGEVSSWSDNGGVAKALQIHRYAKPKNPNTYMNISDKPKYESQEEVDAPRQRILEYLMSALRLTSGVSLDAFESRTGLHARLLGPFIQAGIERGWLEAVPGKLRATQTGIQNLNALLLLSP